MAFSRLLLANRSNLYPLVQQAINKGIKQDSFRRALNRAGTPTRGLNLGAVFARAREERSVAERITHIGRAARPTVARTTMPSEMRQPYNYRYVVRVDMLNADTGETFSRRVSIWDNHLMTRGTAENSVLRYAEQLNEEESDTDPERKENRFDRKGFHPQSSTLEMVYRQEGT